MQIYRPLLEPGHKSVIVIGGGFAGLAAARRLATQANLHVTLADQRNHHLFQPLLYQVATAGLNPADIAVPIRSQFPGKANVAVHLGRVTRIALAERFVEGEGVRVGYDFLILACGAQHNYFGHHAWEEFAPGLKTLEQATEIRRRILTAFELAENEPDPAKQRELLGFVIVGGGPTGVELAGAIADIARTVLVRDFRRINSAHARVLLVEAGPRILASFSEDLSRRATADLGRLGVDVRTGVPVTHVDAGGIQLGEQRVSARNVFWAAGVEADAVTRSLGVPLDRAGRVVVTDDLSVPGFREVFVVGDAAHVEVNGQLVPGLAPAAIQQGKLAAENVIALAAGRETKPFHYRDKGTMATIGKHLAIVQIGKLKLTGYVAWVIWLFVHVLSITGFRNRVAVFLEWTWSYLFSRRGARLITHPDWRSVQRGATLPAPALGGDTARNEHSASDRRGDGATARTPLSSGGAAERRPA
ncbi:MAG TPA: NAD(P)/FAD-dependent oxidoreductase [Polyangiaceae bacterium]|nr:NAD(P)/FAD-dependent oxidoreductase [Polyangiaceae bacterium]